MRTMMSLVSMGFAAPSRRLGETMIAPLDPFEAAL